MMYFNLKNIAVADFSISNEYNDVVHERGNRKEIIHKFFQTII